MKKLKMPLLEIAEKQYQIDVSRPSRAKLKFQRHFLDSYKERFTIPRLRAHGLTLESPEYLEARTQIEEAHKEKVVREEGIFAFLAKKKEQIVMAI
jgi:hypothetical protein